MQEEEARQLTVECAEQINDIVGLIEREREQISVDDCITCKLETAPSFSGVDFTSSQNVRY